MLSLSHLYIYISPPLPPRFARAASFCMRSWERTKRERESWVLRLEATCLGGWSLRVAAQGGCFCVCMLFCSHLAGFYGGVAFVALSARCVCCKCAHAFCSQLLSLSLSRPSLSVRSEPGAKPKEGLRGPTDGRKKKTIKIKVKKTGEESTRTATFRGEWKVLIGGGSKSRGGCPSSVKSSATSTLGM